MWAQLECEWVPADVVVVGAGAAGLCAALTATRAGMLTVVVADGPGSATKMAMGGMTVLPPWGEGQASSLVRDVLSAGAGLPEPALVSAYVRRLEGLTELLRSLGIALESEGLAPRLFRPDERHSVPRNAWIQGGGANLVHRLCRVCEESGARMLNNVRALLLISDPGKVSGVMAADIRRQRWIGIISPRVILATGGGGALYYPTTCPSSATGEGLAMALQAGAVLADMEFVDFFPTAVLWPREKKGLCLSSTLRAKGAVLRNGCGEEIDAPACGPREDLCRAILREVHAGRGSPHGGAYLDMTRVREVPERLARLVTLIDSWGWGRVVEVGPAAHMFCGGIRIDEHGATNVLGLFACGEATAGLHGASVLAGTALSWAVVSGCLAAETASQFEMPWSKLAQERSRAAAAEWLSKVTSGKGALNGSHGASDWERSWLELRANMFRYAGPLRSREGLAKLQAQIHKFASEINESPVRSFQQGVELIALRNRLIVAAAVVRAALQRRETRGVHFREDFPGMAPEALRVLITLDQLWDQPK